VKINGKIISKVSTRLSTTSKKKLSDFPLLENILQPSPINKCSFFEYGVMDYDQEFGFMIKLLYHDASKRIC